MAELFIDDYKLGELIYDKEVLKLALKDGYSKTFLMMGPQNSVRAADFQKDFPIYINYKTKGGNSFKSLIPDWTCKKEKKGVTIDLPYFEPLK